MYLHCPDGPLGQSLAQLCKLLAGLRLSGKQHTCRHYVNLQDAFYFWALELWSQAEEFSTVALMCAGTWTANTLEPG